VCFIVLELIAIYPNSNETKTQVTEVTDMAQSEVSEQTEMLTPPASSDSGRRWALHWIIGVILVLAIIGILGGEIRSRVKAETNLRAVTAQMAVPSVAVVKLKLTGPTEEVVLPGNIQPFISSPIYARTDGYLKKWYYDIGAHVKAGDLLAIIQTPEVDEQLAQARSTLTTAQANLALAQITRDRYESLLKKHAVAQQDADNAEGAYTANKAVVDADTANVRHFEALVSFEKVYAPFDGVITARNTDIGDLINSGSSTAPRTDLFDISQTSALRVYVSVPEEYSQGVKPGETAADITLAEFPGRRFPGKLVRTSDSINTTTRTLLTEIDLDNPEGTLLSGSYAEVHLKIVARNSAFLLPVSSLIFRNEKLQVAVVHNGTASLKDVTPGHDLGDQIEIVAGLKPDDQVIVNPADSLVTGQSVKVVPAALPGDSK
jgi:RND family efflux transporter MFP subunit